MPMQITMLSLCRRTVLTIVVPAHFLALAVHDTQYLVELDTLAEDYCDAVFDPGNEFHNYDERNLHVQCLEHTRRALFERKTERFDDVLVARARVDRKLL